MRCLSCDRKLNDYESTRKYASSGTFVDLCNRCFAEISEDIPDLEGDGFDHDLDDGEFEEGTSFAPDSEGMEIWDGHDDES